MSAELTVLRDVHSVQQNISPFTTTDHAVALVGSFSGNVNVHYNDEGGSRLFEAGMDFAVVFEVRTRLRFGNIHSCQGQSPIQSTCAQRSRDRARASPVSREHFLVGRIGHERT